MEHAARFLKVKLGRMQDRSVCMPFTLTSRRGQLKGLCVMALLSDELLAAYVDGELSPGEIVFVEAELARDPEAQARLQAFRQVSELVRATNGPVAEAAGDQVGCGRGAASWMGVAVSRLLAGVQVIQTWRRWFK